MISLEIILAIVFLIIGFIVLILLVNNNRSTNTSKDEFTLDISLASPEYYLYLSGFGNNVKATIDWGDGNIEKVTSNDNNFLNLIHTYNTIGNYTIKFTKINRISLIGNYNINQPLPVSIDNKITNADFSKVKETPIYVISFYDSLLTNLDISGLNKLSGLNLIKNKLTTESVNIILTTFNSFNTTHYPGTDYGTIDLSNQNPSAPPSSGPPDGITAKANLISRGWTVNTD